ncbi:MAG: hypothetical protein ACRELF_21380 [Gemmataceae bacterium]
MTFQQDLPSLSYWIKTVAYYLKHAVVKNRGIGPNDMLDDACDALNCYGTAPADDCWELCDMARTVIYHRAPFLHSVVRLDEYRRLCLQNRLQY